MNSLAETDLTEQTPPEAAGQPEPPQPPPTGAPPMPDMGAPGGEMEPPPGAIEGIQGEVGGMGDPGMMGYGMEQPKDPTHLGRVYELNKIYYRLHIIHKWLMNSPDKQLEETRKIATEAYDIFKLIMNNLASYKDKVDDIILQFSNFVANLSILLAKHTKQKNALEKEEEQKKEEPNEDE